MRIAAGDIIRVVIAVIMYVAKNGNKKFSMRCENTCMLSRRKRLIRLYIQILWTLWRDEGREEVSLAF